MKKQIKHLSKAMVQVTTGFVIVLISAITFSASMDYAAKSLADYVCPPPLQNCVDTAMPNQNGKTFTANDATELKQALVAAKLGDTIVLTAGKNFKGPITLPNKSGSGWIVIKTSKASNLSAEGIRINPSQSSLMPKISTDDAEPAIRAADGAHHYRFIGVEVASENKSTKVTTTNLILLGDGNQTASEVPHHIIFDRSYIHGNSSGDMRRALAMNGRHLAVIDSYVSEAHEIGADSQAIGGWSGDGPFKIVNNYLEGAGENVLFGGSKAQSGLDPKDLEFRKNYVHKPLSWRGSKWSVKNLFEFKNMRRSLIDGNIFENNWSAAQTGTAILITPKSSGGPNVAVNDITFTNNIVRHASAGFQLMGTDYTDDRYPKQGVQVNRIIIYNNLFEDISGDNWKGSGRFILLTSGPGPSQLTVDHNTVNQDGTALTMDGEKMGVQKFTFTNNVINHNQYGVFGSGNTPGIKSMKEYLASDYVFKRNVLVGGKSDNYPADNYFPGSNSGSFQATDNKLVGVDMNALNEAVRGVTSGNPSLAISPPAPAPTSSNPTPPPAVTPGSVSGSIITSPAPSEPVVQTPGTYSDGSLIYDNGVIYVMEYQRKRPFASMEVFNGLGFKLVNVADIDASNISEGPGVFTSQTRHPRGVLVNDRGAVYFMGDAQRYGFPSAEIFHSWGNEFQDVVTANTLDRQIPEGAVVQSK
jgi:hypothetical protein